MSSDRVLALVGPTAAGKSEIALAVAERLGAEIVAVDAFTVYRGMDVGTAKPSVEDRRRLAHHLVDVLEPDQECTVDWFQAEARAAIDDVHARGKAALLVGGSGLYFRAVVDDLRFPPTDSTVRIALEQRHAADPVAAHEALVAADPVAAARIEPGNLRRTVRALEVIEITGRPFSDWRTAWESYESVYPGLEVVGVDIDRPTLDERIRQRVDRMLEGGLLDEAGVLATGELSTTARQAIGYQEVLDHLAGKLALPEVAERIRARTRRYAVRQQRWFRADPRVEWVSGSETHDVLLRRAYKESPPR